MTVRARQPRPRSTNARFLLLASILAPLVAVGCGDDDGGTAAIRDLLDREVKAINARDLNGLSEVWAQDDQITLFDVPPPGRFQGWQVIGHQWKSFFDRFSEIHLETASVRIDMAGDAAWATYDWTLTGTMGDRPLADRGQATAIYRRGEKGWRLVHAHYSPAPAGTASATPGAGTAAAAPAAAKPPGS